MKVDALKRLSVTNRQRVKKINCRLLKQIAASALTDLDVASADLGIVLVSAPEIIKLNEQFLRHAGPTDVIAFDYGVGVPPAGGPPNRLKPGLPTLHGEIFICVDEAVRQAGKFKTSWQSEAVRYMVPGVVHLLGHDDRRLPDRRKMKRAEVRRLRELSRRFALSKL